MEEYDGHIDYTDVPEEFQEVRQSLDSFVKVNYETAQTMIADTKLSSADITHYKGKILDIIRNNPPLASIPKYFRDGREDYLWYSDFFDEVGKDVYHKYRIFVKPANEISPANYTEELAKVDLPYFRELVNLISLERSCMDYEEKEPKAIKEINHTEESSLDEKQATTGKAESELVTKSKSKRTLDKRSYEPKLTDEQYIILADCIERIKLFRSPIKVPVIKKLLKGKLPEPLQVTNQKSLVYLLDQLSEYKYIKATWVSVADGNKDFISFRTDGNKQRYGNEPHFIPMQQMLNDRKRNQREAIHGLIKIEEMIELMEENRDK